MNDVEALKNLLGNKKYLLSYILQMILSSEKNAQGLRTMKERGFSQEGMLEKVIEVTAIQSEQIKHLALVALIYAQDRNFDSAVAILAIKLGGSPQDVLRKMWESKKV